MSNALWIHLGATPPQTGLDCRQPEELILYNHRRRRYFSPISHIPGPFFASVSRLWHVRQILRGKQNYKLLELHEKHGHFVRIAHNEVSVSHPHGVKALYLASVPKASTTSCTSLNALTGVHRVTGTESLFPLTGDFPQPYPFETRRKRQSS